MEIEVEIPVKGAIVGGDSAALDLSGEVPHDRESEQSFQPCPLGKEKTKKKGDLGEHSDIQTVVIGGKLWKGL